MRVYDKMAPLTEEERRFAEQNYIVLENYLRYRRISYSEYYDVCAYGFLKAVKRWFSRPELHVYSFTTIANKAMWSYVYSEKQKQKRRIQTVSLDEILPGTEGITYLDTITYRNTDFQYSCYG